MAVPARDSSESYEDYYRRNADQFTAFLRRTLGRQGEDVGGRVAVADTLQEAMLVAHTRWPELARVESDERDRCVYRCLRDAAGEALRREHGRLAKEHGRPRVVAFDFGLLHERDDDVTSARERELTTAVLGSMAADVAAAGQSGSRRELLDRAVLLAGLRALSEREVIVLIAVDHLGWEQDELAEHLDLANVALRTVLFEARRVFYGVVRHTAGIELDDEERARLCAYQAGELAGRERRVARRHLQHCEACQGLVREMDRFGGGAQHVLAPLPFVFGASALARRAPAKSTAGGAAAGLGLLGQAGAAKALGVTVAFLSVGVGVSGWLAERGSAPPHGPEERAATFGVESSLGTITAGLLAPRTTKPKATTSGSSKRETTKRKTPQRSKRAVRAAAAPSAREAAAAPAAAQETAPVVPVAPAAAAPAANPPAPPASSGTGGSSSGNSSKSTGGGSATGGGEFFAG